MKSIAAWFGVTLSAFGAMAGLYHQRLDEVPRSTVVVLDASFAMQRSWSAARQALDELDNDRYAAFSLYTDKGRVHDAASALRLGTLTPYAPRDLARLTTSLDTAAASVAGGADEQVLVTNLTDAEYPAPDDWTVVRLGR